MCALALSAIVGRMKNTAAAANRYITEGAEITVGDTVQVGNGCGAAWGATRFTVVAADAKTLDVRAEDGREIVGGKRWGFTKIAA